jgi:hypothetical protein
VFFAFQLEETFRTKSEKQGAETFRVLEEGGQLPNLELSNFSEAMDGEPKLRIK